VEEVEEEPRGLADAISNQFVSLMDLMPLCSCGRCYVAAAV
jgi:hypothetical protein